MLPVNIFGVMDRNCLFLKFKNENFDGMPLLDAILTIYNTFDAFNFGGAKPNARLPTFPII